MSVIHSYSSVTVSDSLDTGNLVTYLTCNQPTSVVYNPNTNVYTPNWSNSNLAVTPVITYNGTSLGLTASGLTISFTRRDGSSSATALETGESVSNGVLRVTQNKLETSQSGLITYICDVSYIDPNTGTTASTQNVMSFSLVSSASETKSVYITGETAFLYDSDRNLVGSNKIVLTADASNVSISKWQYLNSTGEYVDYPTTNNASINTGTLNVFSTESGIWVNGRIATIRVLTSDPNTYDVHQIIKIFDGVAGNATVSVVLSNQSHYVPCDDNGDVLSWTGASTQIYVYEGGIDVTNTWTITATAGNGLTGSFSNNVYTPSGLTDDTSYVDFTCTKSGYSNLSTRYTITKARSGADGESAIIYELSADTYVLNLDNESTFTPRTVTFSAYSKTGAALVKESYDGRFIIAESTNGTTYVNKYTSSSNESSKEYTPSATDVLSIRCRLYASSGTSTLLDEQTVVITRDGTLGENGIPGLSIGLANNQDVLPCNEAGYVLGARQIRIPFYAYIGIQRIPVTAQITSALPNGMVLQSNTAGTSKKDGLLILSVVNNATLGTLTELTGTISIRLIPDYTGYDFADQVTFIFADEQDNILVDENDNMLSDKEISDFVYKWTKNLQGADGENANFLQIYSEDGGIIRNSQGSTTLKVRYISGASEVTPTSVQWYKFVNGNYTSISGGNQTSFIVTADMVDDLEFFKAVAVYAGVSCEAYYTVDDIADLFMAQTISTVREFKNGEGCGAIYTRLYRGTEEVDPLKSVVFSTVAPTSPESGDFYYALDSQAKTCTLKTYNGSAWVTASENYTYTYKYFRIDKTGKTLDTSTPYKTQRCIFVDPSIINDSMQFVCEIYE